VNDAFGVCGVEGVHYFYRKIQELIERQGVAGDAIFQGGAFQQFHGDEGESVLFGDFVDGANVGVIEGGGGARLQPKTLESSAVPCQVWREKLESHMTPEAQVFRFIYDTHASAAEFFDDAVMGDGFPEFGDGVWHFALILGSDIRQVNEYRLLCRRKMRMSGLCKVEMSAFMDGRGPHGNGANHFEPARTGPIESVARGTRPAIESQAGSPLRAEDFDSRGSALCRLRAHSGR